VSCLGTGTFRILGLSALKVPISIASAIDARDRAVDSRSIDDFEDDPGGWRTGRTLGLLD